MRNSTKISKLTVAVAAALSLTSISALSQEVENSEGANDFEVISIAGVRGSLARGLSQRQDAVGVLDAVSAEELGKFPDINLSESLQRIPGITLSRDDGGRGQAINLRGLGPEYTRVEINGMTAPSNGSVGGGRGFDFGLLPSELFGNAAVFKTSRARDAEGGLAGLLQLSTPKPLSSKGLQVVVSGQADYSENADDIGSRTALFISNNTDDTYGVSASIVRTEQQYQSNQVGGFSIRPLNIILTPEARSQATEEELAAQASNIPHYIHDFEDRETLSANLAFQWRPSDSFELLLNGLYSDLDADRYFTRADAPTEGNVSGFSDLVIENGLVTSGTFSGVQQRLGVNDGSSEESMGQYTAQAKWSFAPNWEVKPFVGYSKREVDRVGNLLSFRRADLETGEFVDADISYQYDGDFVDWSTPGTDYSTNPEEFLLNVFLFRPTSDEDKDLTTKLDFTRYFDDGALSNLDFGVRYSDRELARTGADTRIVAASGVDRRTLPSLADALTILDDFTVSGAPASVPSNIMGVDPNLAVSLFTPNGIGSGESIDGTSISPRPLVSAQRSFDVEEKTFNAYIEGTFDLDELVVNTGVRYVKTNQVANGFSITNDEPFPISLSSDYKAFLPSISMRYELDLDVAVRAAYARTLTRPSLTDMAPTEIVSGVDEGGGTGTQGNPDLTPFTADNLDFGFDWYFDEIGYASINVFYKQITNIIDTESFTEDRTFPRQRDNVEVTAPIVFTRPSNGASATIEGIELALQYPFSMFTDGLWSNAGIIANYTYATSEADFSDVGDVRSSGLPGLSENSYNFAAYYDDGRFEARLAYAWRSEYLEAFSGTFGIPRFEDSRGQLDFSASYELLEGLNIQFQALNLTGEERVQTSTAQYNAPNNVRELDRRLLVGARYKF